MPKNAEIFLCEPCDFKCCKKSNYTSHLLTLKHKKIVNDDKMITNDDEKMPKNAEKNFHCVCGKSYKHRQGLWKHTKTCNETIDEPVLANEITEYPINMVQMEPSHILEFIKQNQEFKNMMIEQNNKILEQQNKIMELSSQVSVIHNNNTTNNNNNTTNNQFNLNVFLNETCKDAMNIKDFIENLQIQMKELENVGKNGYVIGITDIILNRLNQIDITKRPLHCTDLKRETMYFRDDNEWNKDNEDKTKLKQVIGKVASKNYRKIPEWRKQNPECNIIEDTKYEFCIQLMRNSIGDLDEKQEKMNDKIVKNIAKNVFVNKNSIDKKE